MVGGAKRAARDGAKACQQMSRSPVAYQYDKDSACPNSFVPYPASPCSSDAAQIEQSYWHLFARGGGGCYGGPLRSRDRWRLVPSAVAFFWGCARDFSHLAKK
ncbi:uncharacterized protein YALI1_A02819g [Yarrowia lipolytica]|uniref:Uncharacterized protein n=1 Tax=Yarrowia lipolytica TaxID=4952 RepID=A0A1D8N3G5_YARLL|nr:hypothetical protein YALI1_A02819g [Yarrowia lipolytica]